MTPAAIRIVSQLRHEFYSSFAAAMAVPVNVTHGNSYASNLPKASWIDSRQQLNYVCIYAHIAPDELVPNRPLILRLAVNKGADLVVLAKQGSNRNGLNRSWYFELTLLPEEILDFLPWLISLIKLYDVGSTSFVPEPPHPFDSRTSDMPTFRTAWTYQADSQFSKLPKQVVPSA